jgi:hypothetical protein
MPRSILPNFRNALLAADQPPDAGEIENADPEPVPQSIIRHAGVPRAVDDIDVADFVAFTFDQRRQETMQAVEIRQRQEDVPTERFQAASRVARAVAQYRVADRIGNARLQFLEAGRFAAEALTCDQPDARLACFERADHGGQERRIVLAVPIERYDEGPACCADAGAHGRRLAA